MSKFIAEFIGTAALVLFGCGAAVLGGAGLAPGADLAAVGQLGIALAFGFAIVAMAYGIGPVSGCHVNPAVSLGVFLAGRMTVREMGLYWAAQFTGAAAGAVVLAAIAGTDGGLGQNGWGPGYLGEFSLGAAFTFEVVSVAPRITTMNRAVIHIVGIRVTGVSVNPARSFGPAVLVGGQAVAQLWLFFAAPLLGAALAALLFRFRLLSTEPVQAPGPVAVAEPSATG